MNMVKLLIVLLSAFAVNAFSFSRSRIISASQSRMSMFLQPHDIIDQMQNFQHAFDIHNALLISEEDISNVVQAVPEAAAEVSRYSVVDKTGFIGVIAENVENAIDFGHNILQKVGIKYTYGFSIILFTFFVKLVTLPLTTKQLESTTKMQQLTPLQQKIQKVYANDEQAKNQMMAQLFQTANVNPLAGCLPAIVQIPIFISLYRAIQNLIAENKLDEPFLWIPDLQGPVYMNSPSSSMDWIKSAVTGSPNLGWSDTLAFLSIPVILYISQSISQKILQPPKDPNKILTEQEQISQGLINNLPFIVAFFSINVPAGLGLYWIINNILTTLITIVVKKRFANEPLPIEVTKMMAALEAGSAGMVTPKKSAGPGKSELRGFSDSDTSVSKKEGFQKSTTNAVDAVFSEPSKTSTVSEDKDDDGDSDEDKSESTSPTTSSDDAAPSKRVSKSKSRASDKKEKRRK